MGLFGKLFGGGKEETPAGAVEKDLIFAPLSGTAIPLEEIGDGVFSEGVLGQGCGIKPDAEMVAAPFDGTVTQVADTKHAIGLEGVGGVELLIHVGMDTVEMNGKGFQALVKVGDQVKRGQTLMTFSRQAIAEAGFADTTAIVVTNTDSCESVSLLKTGTVSAGEELLQVK